LNIVVASLKGGVGKTTTAVYLAAAAASLGRGAVTLVDADRQASAAEWLESCPMEGVDVLEAPSERTVTRAATRGGEFTIVDTPPGDERITRAAVALAQVVVVPTRAAGVEYRPAGDTLALVGGRTPAGVIVSAARLGTNDLDEAIAWWEEQRVPLWGVIPERVAIAAGPEARLSRDGLDHYAEVLETLRRAAKRRR